MARSVYLLADSVLRSGSLFLLTRDKNRCIVLSMNAAETRDPTTPFQPTHLLYTGARYLVVMRVGSQMFTTEEWKDGASAEWSLSDAGALLHRGAPPNAASRWTPHLWSPTDRDRFILRTAAGRDLDSVVTYESGGVVGPPGRAPDPSVAAEIKALWGMGLLERSTYGEPYHYHLTHCGRRFIDERFDSDASV